MITSWMDNLMWVGGHVCAFYHCKVGKYIEKKSFLPYYKYDNGSEGSCGRSFIGIFDPIS